MNEISQPRTPSLQRDRPTDHMEVEVTYAGLVRRARGCRSEQVVAPTGSQLRTILEELGSRHPAVKQYVYDGGPTLRDGCAVFLDGRNVRSVDTCVDAERATVRIVVLAPMVAGG